MNKKRMERFENKYKMKKVQIQNQILNLRIWFVFIKPLCSLEQDHQKTGKNA